jgi:tartrate-resistant acid phosphatase type 5
VSILRSWLLFSQLSCAASLVLGVVAFGGVRQSTATREAGHEQLDRLPNAWREAAVRFEVFKGDYAEERSPDFAAMNEEELKGWVLHTLAMTPGAEDFVLEHLSDRVAIKDQTEILDLISSGGQWKNDSRVERSLEQLALQDPNPRLASAALAALHEFQSRRVQEAIRDRILALSGGQLSDVPSEETTALESEDEKLAYDVDRIILPSGLRRPGPVFRVNVQGPAIRVVAVGNFGTGSIVAQTKAAKGITEFNKKKPFDLGITLGDNFYHDDFDPEALSETEWKNSWDELYGKMKIPFYPIFGNHDWGESRPAEEILRSYKSDTTWHFVAPYYTFVAGPVQFFALNLNAPTPAQMRWLQTELDKSKARWKVVYGHYPIYSSWSGYPGEDPLLGAKLMPILRGRADVYLSGHRCALEHHQPVEGVNFFLAGGSVADLTPVVESSPGTIFAKAVHGFGILEADENSLTFRWIEDNGTELHAATIRK